MGGIHVGIVREHEHEGNGSEHICMCKSKGMGGIGVTEHGDGGEKKFPVTQHASRCLTQHGGRMGVLPISGQFRFWSKFKVPSCVQKWPSLKY